MNVDGPDLNLTMTRERGGWRLRLNAPDLHVSVWAESPSGALVNADSAIHRLRSALVLTAGEVTA